MAYNGLVADARQISYARGIRIRYNVTAGYKTTITDGRQILLAAGAYTNKLLVIPTHRLWQSVALS